MKLRLLLTKMCNRHCEGCCNKGWDLDKLPKCTSFSPYDLIMITGGEPLLYKQQLYSQIIAIRQQNKHCQLIVYTAKPDDPAYMRMLLGYVTGLTITLHEQKDVRDLLALDKFLTDEDVVDKTLRLNVFRGVELDRDSLTCLWEVKDSMDWIEDCPLPPDEVFMKVW